MEFNDKELDQFIDKLMVNDSLEKPSSDFTNTVLNNLDIKPLVITYKPLIPKWMWVVISAFFLALVTYSLSNQQDFGAESKLSELFNLSQIEFNPLENINFNFSKTLIYSMVAFSVMIALQVPLLKSYLNSRLKF